MTTERASHHATSYRSVPGMLLQRAASDGERPAYTYPVGDAWQTINWRQTLDRAEAVACGLLSLGVTREQRCAIIANTRIEWVLADFGILCAGATTTTVYPSSTPDECLHILLDSDTVVVFAEDDEQIGKLLRGRDRLANVRQVITFDGHAGHDGWVITLAQLEALGRDHGREHPGHFLEVAEGCAPHHLATLIYTSGTTGTPKGVELLHDCWVFEGEAIRSTGFLHLTDLQYLWLPLSHSFGKVLQATQLAIGFATAIDGRIPKLVDNLALIRPTFMAAAPRIFEKVYNKVVLAAQAGGPIKYGIFKWAVGVGKAAATERDAGKPLGAWLRLQYALAHKLVFAKLHARFGGRLRFFVSGSAPLSQDIAQFFNAANITILEGYGLTESSAASFVNTPADNRYGTVGPPVPGIEVKIDPTDGEILLRGRGIMRGYHNMPEATAEVLDGDGWLRTGDIGELHGGYLTITERKKDLIKTSGGKYVSPQALEARFKALCPHIGQVVVHGNARNFCTALVTLDEESLTTWAQGNGHASASYARLIEDAEVIAMVDDALARLNEDLPSYATIKKYAILPRDFSIAEGELTPSLKVKRKFVEQRYQHLLDGFYTNEISTL